MTILSEDEIERYARHIVLSEVGGAGQQKLKAARVLVIGAGGLGSPVLLYLAAAGVGKLGIVDDDTVSLSNLQRQVLHETSDIGVPKVESAKTATKALNPHVKINAFNFRLTEENAASIVQTFDILIDGSDNLATRLLCAETCERLGKPLIYAAISRFDGQITVFAPHLNEANPRYRDLFPHMPDEASLPTCAQVGIIGALPGVIGTLAAMEAIKLITGIGKPLIGRLLLYDGLNASFEEILYRRREKS
ncbi:molybdopterin-synthase adenylyltransferase MoeB [Limoniibacter endophyticus]|uniref:Molybdopterin-synthase adenylyltransferase n=1 Tax=Limoniibacter endophyticus TaxID=1565040 RepID=A0A8J3GG71_9HYPH|nr:molybdopterin-synthase adenylyltransferase MoeB [Limoniibacter endophyticus]GHC67057.1 thiamine biosynthesis protein ThiF [Limoniibacter endophyticus]